MITIFSSKSWAGVFNIDIFLLVAVVCRYCVRLALIAFAQGKDLRASVATSATGDADVAGAGASLSVFQLPVAKTATATCRSWDATVRLCCCLCVCMCVCMCVCYSSPIHRRS